MNELRDFLWEHHTITGIGCFAIVLLFIIWLMFCTKTEKTNHRH